MSNQKNLQILLPWTPRNKKKGVYLFILAKFINHYAQPSSKPLFFKKRKFMSLPCFSLIKNISSLRVISMFYLNFYPQCLALGFQSIFAGLNSVKRTIVSDLKCFPSSSTQTKSVQIQSCTSSRIPVHWRFKVLNWRVLYHGELTWKWQAERNREVHHNSQFVTTDKLLGEYILGKE